MFEPIWRRETELHIWGPPRRSPRWSSGSRCTSPSAVPGPPVGGAGRRSSTTTRPSRVADRRCALLLERDHPPGLTVGYRIESRGRSLAYLTDHEPALGADLTSDAPDWISGFALAHRPTCWSTMPVHAAGARPAGFRAFVDRARGTVRPDDRGRPGAAVPSRSDALGRSARRHARRRRRSLGRGGRSLHGRLGGCRDRRLTSEGARSDAPRSSTIPPDREGPTRDRRVGRTPIGYLQDRRGKGCCPCTRNSGCSGMMSSPLARWRVLRSRRDGSIGKVDELTDEVGRSAVVVDTGPWIFGRKVVILPGRSSRST